MEEGGVGLVLARATELRLKISNCINKATTSSAIAPQNGVFLKRRGRAGMNGNGNFSRYKNPKAGEVADDGEEDEEEEDDEKTEKLLGIRDALETLEAQLIALQNLQQQQRYEREVALSEIDYSRTMLLEKLKDYKGKHMEVIHETSAFVDETVENNSDLLLPPYPSRPPRSLVLANGYWSYSQSMSKSTPNGFISGSATYDGKEDVLDCERNQGENKLKNSRKGLAHLISSVAKMVLPIVGVIYVISLSKVGHSFGKENTPFKFLGLLQRPSTKGKNLTAQCPPGKVPVMEGGEVRCLVKERVEIPFESFAAKPDVNYGCG